jgi:hypothetical protein
VNLFLITAAVLIIATGLAHSWLGERYIIRRLLRRDDLPALFGDDSFTRQTVRYAWHLTTVAWLGLASVLLVVGGAFPVLGVGDALVFAVAQTFVLSAVLALLLTRARHLSWVVFVAIAALCLLTLR